MHYRISYSPSLVQKNSLSTYVSPLPPSSLLPLNSSRFRTRKSFSNPYSFYLPPRHEKRTLLSVSPWSKHYSCSVTHVGEETIFAPMAFTRSSALQMKMNKSRMCARSFSSLTHVFTRLLRFQTISNDWSSYSRVTNRVSLCPRAKTSAHSILTTTTRALSGRILHLWPIFWLTVDKKKASLMKMKMIRLRKSNFTTTDKPNSCPSQTPSLSV